MGGVVDHVLEQRAERDRELETFAVGIGDGSDEVGLGEALHERALLDLERVPTRAQVAERREIRGAGNARG